MDGEEHLVTNKSVCKKCGHANYDLDIESDQHKCRQCGFVMYDNCFESGVQFTDTKIDGQLHDMSKMGKDNTKYAEECIDTMIRDLKLKSEYPEYLEQISETPIRIMKFAYKAFFLDHGSNIHHYSAAALYIALRFQKAPFLLMDFSDKLCINLFKLARCYRKLANFLNVTLKLNERLPSIDPSIYIPRFCKMLEFGERIDQVKETAIKLLKRMKMDWMSHGRRPSSLCGAAILIAARMHGFKRSMSEVCKIVFVCEETLRKRLEEFKETDVAQLTREKFDEIDDIQMLGRERDPPAFQKALRNVEQLEIKKLKQKEENDDELNKQLEDAANIIEIEVKQTNYLNLSKRDYEEDSDQKIINVFPRSKETSEVINRKNEEIKFEVREDLSEMSDEEAKLLILSNEEHAVKSILWHSMNEKWLREQQRKDPKEEKKEGKKRNKRRNDQLMNEEDPVDAIFKCKKIKDNLDEKKIREIYRQISNVKSMKLKDIFLSENPPLESLEISQRIVHQDLLFKNLPGYNLLNDRFAPNPATLPRQSLIHSAPQHDEEGYEYE